MKTKSLITEIVLLTGLFIMWYLVYNLLLTRPFFYPLLDINLHKIYFFNFNWRVIIVGPYLMIVTSLYFVREGFYGYRRKLQNWILICSDFMFILLSPTLFSILQLVVKESSGWMNKISTIYPPLSALSKNDPHAITENQFGQYITMVDSIANVKLIFLIIFLLILVISCILTGKNWNTKYERKS